MVVNKEIYIWLSFRVQMQSAKFQNGASILHFLPVRPRDLHGRWSRRILRFRSNVMTGNECWLYMTGLLCRGTHTKCACLYKNCTRSSQLRFQHGRGSVHEYLPLAEELWHFRVSGGVKTGCGPCKVYHPSVDGPTLMNMRSTN